MTWKRLIIIVVLTTGLGGCGGSAPVAPPQVRLTSIAVTPSTGSYLLPATEQFTATGHYSDASTKDITQSATWSSTDNSVATVDNSAGSQGMATMVGSGNANITAAMASLQGSTSISVSSSVGVSVSPTFASVTVTHQTQAFSAAVQGTTNTAVTWSVDGMAGGNSTLGTISNSGIYTPPSTKGFHTIAATSNIDIAKSASAQVAVTDVAGIFTRHYDNARTGQNPDEIVLTSQNVNMQQFGLLFSYPVDGNVLATPLYVANVNVPGKGYHNIAYVATPHDTVYAFDADNRSPGLIWQKSLLNASAGETPVPCTELPDFCVVGPEVGITGTPVIDPSTGTLYVDTFSEIGGTYYHKLHALDITTGAEKFGGPVTIQGSVAGIGDSSNGTNVAFIPIQHLQRTALLLANGNVYVAFASYDDQRPYHGWVFAYNAANLQQVAVFNATPDGHGAGIWQGGGGLSADTSGNIYLTTGNGDFTADTGGRDYGDSVIKLSPTLSVEDYFTPYNQATLDPEDLDLGSGGLLLLPDQSGPYPHLGVGDGKPGEIYLVNRDNLGHFHAGDDSQIVQSLPGATGLVMTSPVYWNGHLYIMDQNNALTMFGLQNGQISSSPQAQATINSGRSFALSSNGSQGGILWTTQVISGVGGLLAAYDATNLSELYDSNQAGTRDFAGGAVEFQEPMIVNGKVYLGVQRQIIVYGLLPQ